MTKQAAVPAGAPVTTDLGVAEYLEAYPDFFERNPQLLQRIRRLREELGQPIQS